MHELSLRTIQGYDECRVSYSLYQMKAGSSQALEMKILKRRLERIDEKLDSKLDNPLVHCSRDLKTLLAEYESMVSLITRLP
uniref:Aspartyl-phosphate phosphatase Spo0E family protein n=1 Tax=Caenorhabditis tropicalis TaxID=1561998 RepID=A0A1I7UR76_9PELO